MLKSASLNHHIIQLAHLVLFVIVTGLMVVHTTFWDFNNIYSFIGGKLVEQRNGGPVVCVTMYLVASLMFAVKILVACHERRKNGWEIVSLTYHSLPKMLWLMIVNSKMFLAPILAAKLISFALIDMIVVMGWKVHTPARTWTKQTSITFGILNLFFQACIFGLVALLAKSLGEEEMERVRDEKLSHRESEDVSTHVVNGA
jgi:hypothetical protein